MSTPTISIAKKQGALQMEVIERDTSGEHITLQHTGEAGAPTIITLPLEEWNFLFEGDNVMVDLIITRVGIGETVQ